jgi:hypothetical protein
MTSKLDKLHILVCITAAASVTLACILRGESLFTMALLSSAAIILFWFLGNLTRYYLVTRVFPPPSEEAIKDEANADPATDGDAALANTQTKAELPAGDDYMSRE